MMPCALGLACPADPAASELWQEEHRWLAVLALGPWALRGCIHSHHEVHHGGQERQHRRIVEGCGQAIPLCRSGLEIEGSRAQVYAQGYVKEGVGGRSQPSGRFIWILSRATGRERSGIDDSRLPKNGSKE